VYCTRCSNIKKEHYDHEEHDTKAFCAQAHQASLLHDCNDEKEGLQTIPLDFFAHQQHTATITPTSSTFWSLVVFQISTTRTTSFSDNGIISSGKQLSLKQVPLDKTSTMAYQLVSRIDTPLAWI